MDEFSDEDRAEVAACIYVRLLNRNDWGGLNNLLELVSMSGNYMPLMWPVVKSLLATEAGINGYHSKV